MFIMGTTCTAEVLLGVIGSTNGMFAFWQNNSVATHVCKNIPHCSWSRCVWQLWMDTDFGSFADKASLKQTHKQIGMVTDGCIYEYYAGRCDVELFNKGSRRTWEWRDRRHHDAPNMEMQNEQQNTIRSSKSICGYFAGILRVLCGYFAGVLRKLRIMFFSRHSVLNSQGFCGKGWWRGGGRAWEPEVAPNMRSRVTVGHVWKQWANTRASPPSKNAANCSDMPSLMNGDNSCTSRYPQLWCSLGLSRVI